MSNFVASYLAIWAFIGTLVIAYWVYIFISFYKREREEWAEMIGRKLNG